MSLDEHDDGQGESGAGEIVFSIIGIQHQPDKLHRKADPEEQIELYETKEDLVVGIHGLDLSVSTKELVHLPAKFCVNLPAEEDIG